MIAGGERSEAGAAGRRRRASGCAPSARAAIDHEILVWISDPEAGVGSVRSEILNRVWALFKENGIVIPNPQRDIHVKEWPKPAPDDIPPSSGT